MPTTPISFTVRQVIQDGKWDSIDAEPRWEPGVAPEITEVIVREGEVSVKGINFSNEGRTKYWADITGTEVGELPDGLRSWSNSMTASAYRVVEDETAPFGGKGLRMRADGIAIDTVTFEFQTFVKQVYVETMAWIKLHRFNVPGEEESPQVKTFRVVEGNGQSSMQALPFSTDCTIVQQIESGYIPQISCRPGFGGTAFYAPSGVSVSEETYNRTTIYFSEGSETTTGGRVWKIGSIEGFANSSLVSPQHFSAPETGFPAETSLVGEALPVRENLPPTSLGLKRVSLPYYHRIYQDTEVRIGMLYCADSQERFLLSTASNSLDIRTNNSVTLPEAIATLTSSELKVQVPRGFPSKPWYLYRVNHDGLISNPVEVVDA